MAAFSREVARRIFAEELRNSNYSFRDGEDQNQYTPQYLLTPTGAKCNRVFVVGTLTEKDNIGSDTEYWRGRVVDPTGSILIYAGQYQPEAAQILSSMDAPAFVSVMGKPNLYQTEDGNILISLRAESIQRVDEATRNQWIMDTARRTLERLKVLAHTTPGVCGEFSTADKALPPANQQDAARALDHYHTDIEHYKRMLVRALTSLKSDLANTPAPLEAEIAKSTASEYDFGASADQADPLKKEEEKREKRSEAKQEEKQPVKKARPRKGGSLDAWPAADEEEEVETFNLGKKS